MNSGLTSEAPARGGTVRVESVWWTAKRTSGAGRAAGRGRDVSDVPLRAGHEVGINALSCSSHGMHHRTRHEMPPAP